MKNKIIIISTIILMAIVLLSVYLIRKNFIIKEYKIENISTIIEKVKESEYFVEDKILNNGITMPSLGLGTWTLSNEQAEECVYEAIKDGYRLIDTAQWNEYPNYTTFKHKNNQKWFALIMDVPYEKLGIDKEGIVNVINLKNISEMLGGLRKDEGIISAYHMNKEHWITILLDGTVQKQKICDLVDISYDLTRKK